MENILTISKCSIGTAKHLKKINKNQYQISDAAKTARVTYKVNDTWDTPDKDFIFQPGGSNMAAGKKVVMNNHAFYGYIEGYNTLPSEIKVIKPAAMYGTTYLQGDLDRLKI